MDKEALRKALIEHLQSEGELLVRAAWMAREEATSEESRAESKYETRGQEAAYLAEGQAKLAAELQETLALYQTLPLPPFPESSPVALGAVVTLSSGKRTARYLVGPRQGGVEIQVGGQAVTVITPSSPLGRQLVGKRFGETVSLPSGKRTEAWKIEAVA